MLALRTNEPIQKAVLTLRKAGKAPARVPEDHDRARARDRRSTIDGGDTSGSPDVVERVSFSFNKIEVEYVPQGKDGQPQGGMTFADQWSDRR